MSRKFLAVMLASVLGAAGVLAMTEHRSATTTATQANAPVPITDTAYAAESGGYSEAYLGDFKSGYADGFNAGVSGYSFPDDSSMTSNARGYLDGYSQGFTDGQSQQATLRNRLCDQASAAVISSAPAVYGQPSRYARSTRTATTRTLGDRAYNNNYNYNPAPRENLGIGSTARKALLIAGGAGAGAGLGGAIGGGKGALIGALVGGGTGTVLAVKKKPSRAFNRRVSKKSLLTKTAIGAGAGVLVGALAGGKRGALAGAALGGGGGALWSLMSGKRSSRR